MKTNPTPPPVSRWQLLRELIAVVMIGVGVVATVVITILLPNWWLLGAEAMVGLGLLLGLRRTPEERADAVVHVVEHAD